MPLTTPLLATLTRLADREADILQHQTTGPEHFVLALLWDAQGRASAALRATPSASDFEIRLREKVEAHDYLPDPTEMSVAVALAVEEANRLKHPRVADYHLLLGITRMDRGIVPALLDELAMRLPLRDELMKVAHQSTWRAKAQGNGGAD